MFTVQTAQRPPVRVDLAPLEPGQKPEDQPHILFKPLTTPGKAAGRGSVRDVLLAGESVDVAGVAFTITAARWGILSWVGVGDEDGQPLEATADNVQKFLEDFEEVYQLVDRLYVQPALGIEAEKKELAPSRNGTSPGRGRRSAGGSSARPAPKGATPARTKKTGPKPKPAKRSGGR